jgi:outer membrane protein OmpA-like peptidoglycan-associated protein
MNHRKEHFMKTLRYLILITVLGLFAGCAAVAPQELVDARTAYQQASVGPAAQLAPAELHQAQAALVLAEQSFEKDPKSYKTRDLAYVAERKAQLAAASGVMAADKERKADADAAFEKKQTELVKQGKEDLSDSEARTAAALAELARLGEVREEERGLVVTLSGNILFRSGESSLMPTANEKLNQMARALLEVGGRNLIVEGYTDSQGSASYNQNLSQRRADTVRNYIVTRGYPSDRIRSIGMGEGSPIADNGSPEGRANNRRVEIVIQPDLHASNL